MLSIFIAFVVGVAVGAGVVHARRETRVDGLHIEIGSLHRKLHQERERNARQHRGPFYLSPAPTSTPDTPEGR